MLYYLHQGDNYTYDFDQNLLLISSVSEHKAEKGQTYFTTVKDLKQTLYSVHHGKLILLYYSKG